MNDPVSNTGDNICKRKERSPVLPDELHIFTVKRGWDGSIPLKDEIRGEMEKLTEIDSLGLIVNIVPRVEYTASV